MSDDPARQSPDVDAPGPEALGSTSSPEGAAMADAAAAVLQHLVSCGADPNEALRLVGAAVIAGHRGAEGLRALGVGERTTKLAVARLKELVAPAAPRP